MIFAHLVLMVVTLAIFVLLTYNYFRNYKEDKLKQSIKYFLFIGLLYLIIAIFSFVWAFSILQYSQGDFLFIYSLVILLQSFFLFIILYDLTKDRKLYFLVVPYVILFFLVLFLGINFMHYFLVASFLFMLLLFFGLVLMKKGYKCSAFLGIFYAVISILFCILFFLDVGDFFYYNLASSVLFLIFIFKFLKNVEECPPEVCIYPEGRKSYFLIFLSHFVFMVVLINFVFVGTIVLHEFGHLTVSNFYDCEYGKIVYDGSFPKTEILCSDASQDNTFLMSAGLLFPLIVSIILILVGGRFLKEMGLLVVGFNLVISFKDFSDLGLSNNLIMLFIILGVFLSVGGIILLARSKTEEYIYSIGS